MKLVFKAKKCCYLGYKTIFPQLPGLKIILDLAVKFFQLFVDVDRILVQFVLPKCQCCLFLRFFCLFCVHSYLRNSAELLTHLWEPEDSAEHFNVSTFSCSRLAEHTELLIPRLHLLNQRFNDIFLLF